MNISFMPLDTTRTFSLIITPILATKVVSHINIMNSRSVFRNITRCDQNGCDYKSKEAGHVRKRKAAIHYIDVIYYLCEVKGCEYKAKQATNVSRHKARTHGLARL